jgi:uncharacterized protein (TIGR00255 family)
MSPSSNRGAAEKAAPASAAPLKSMTGFAEARGEYNGFALRVSLRSVNHRFLDLHLRIPEGLESLEPEIRRVLRERLRRGHVDVTVRVDAVGASAIQINRELAEAYVRAATDLRKQFGLSADPDLMSLLRLPGVVGATGVTSGALDEEELAKLAIHAGETLHEAAKRLEQMQRAEGSALAAEMRSRLAQIASHGCRIGEMAQDLRPAYAARLEARIRELLAEMPMDPARIAQEAAMLAERGDTAEEISRLASHVDQFSKLLDAGGEVGKKLDFLLQEMQREANTLLSKTPGVEATGLAITDLALEIKSEIEKLREQAQNIE